MANSNQPPEIKWSGFVMACGTRRQRLYIDGRETPFFIDTSDRTAHQTMGEPHGLFGSGMGPLIRAKAPYRIAVTLGAGRHIATLKHRAEQMALAENEWA